MELELYQLLLLLSIYSVLGFIISTLYDALMDGRHQCMRVCRGPWCPAFGIGVLALLFTMRFITENPLTAFVAGAVIGSLVEFLGILLTRGLCGERKGKYTWYHFLIYGVGGTIVVTHLHFFIMSLMERISIWFHFAFLVVFLMYFLADYVDGIAALLEKRKESHR